MAGRRLSPGAGRGRAAPQPVGRRRGGAERASGGRFSRAGHLLRLRRLASGAMGGRAAGAPAHRLGSDARLLVGAGEALSQRDLSRVSPFGDSRLDRPGLRGPVPRLFPARPIARPVRGGVSRAGGPGTGLRRRRRPARRGRQRGRRADRRRDRLDPVAGDGAEAQGRSLRLRREVLRSHSRGGRRPGRGAAGRAERPRLPRRCACAATTPCSAPN